MKWRKERDLLIAQTMAFVQAVARKATDPKATNEGRLEPAELNEPAEVERPIEARPTDHPSAARYSELREEIRGRVAAFRAHQELFLRNRDEYCNSILAKVRAETEHPTKTDNQPVKR